MLPHSYPSRGLMDYPGLPMYSFLMERLIFVLKMLYNLKLNFTKC